jgi:16S rRNA (guanine527-N7)-methyltransferase
MTFKDHVKDAIGIELSEVQEKQFEQYFQFLVEYNQITNLTRIVEKEEVYYKHFYDSLLIATTMDMNEVTSICDMGSGAGFPSLPLKIIYPHLSVTIVDSLNKRITFLEQLIKLIDLKRVSLVHDRVELYAIKHQASFDLVTARALGDLSLISEMGLPMTKVGGWFLGLKGLNYEDEFNQAKKGIALLGGTISFVSHKEIPYDFGHRVIIGIHKEKHAEGYPRTFAQMTKKPL